VLPSAPVGSCPVAPAEGTLGGGAIDNHGTLKIESSTLTGNNLAQNGTCTDNGQQVNLQLLDLGGAIYNDGDLEITGSTLSGNTASGSPGALPFDDCFTVEDICAEGGAVMNAGGSATIKDSTLSGNEATGNGAAVFNDDGTVVIISSTFSDNTAEDAAGTVATGAKGLTAISGVTFSGDNSYSELAAMQGSYLESGEPTTIIDNTKFTANSNQYSAYFNGSTPCQGGNPTLEINNSSFTGYSYPAIWACGYNPANGSAFTISGSTFKDNPGGAIEYGGGTISDSTFTGNGSGSFSSHVGGAVDATMPLVVYGSKFTGNGGPETVAGGAIHDTDGLTVTGSTFTGNAAKYVVPAGLGGIYQPTAGGGAIDSFGTLKIDTSTLSGNTASSFSDTQEPGGLEIAGGGAVLNHGTATITDSTLSGNSEASPASISGGGAILDDIGANLTVTNSTIYGNNTGGLIGGAGSTIEQAGNNGSGGNISVTASTFADNTAQAGGGELGDDQGFNTGAVTSDYWTIGQDVFGSSDNLCSYGFSPFFSPYGGTQPVVTDTGYNLTDGSFSGSSPGESWPCWSPVRTDLSGTNPDLDPVGLAHNGGPTETVALELGSPAIDAVPTSTGLCQATDQRGHPRPSWSGGHACDIGAYEFSDIVTKTKVTSSANPATVGQDVTYTATVSPAGSNPVPGGTVAFADGSAIPGCGAVALSAAGTASCTVSYPAPGA
jgi:hypothetical protein